MLDIFYKTIDPLFVKANAAVQTITGPTYIVSLIIIHVIYFMAFFGLVYVNPDYIHELTTFIEVVICVFLMIRFNPFRDPKISSLDVKIIFSAAIFILTNIGVTDFLDVYLDRVKEFVRKYVE